MERRCRKVMFSLWVCIFKVSNQLIIFMFVQVVLHVLYYILFFPRVGKVCYYGILPDAFQDVSMYT